MKGNINKEMVEKMKRSKIFKLESSGNKLTLKINCEKNFKKNVSNSFQ
jgi:hypothetical protein